MTELYACLYAREFPAQSMLRHRPDLRRQPVAILQGTPPRQTVCSCNTPARALGVEPGLTRTELDVFPGVVGLTRSLAEEFSARAALLQAASRFSPRIEYSGVECRTPCHPERTLCEAKGKSRDLHFQMSDTPASASDTPATASDTHSFSAALDIAGTERLFGPPEQLGQQLLRSVRSLGLSVSLVISANLHAALCLARSLPIRIAIIPPGEEARTLAPLPLSVLPLIPGHAETFARWGIATLGALAALPEKELIARLGQQGRRLRQLALGQAPHLLVPASPPFTLEERIELDAPVELLDSLLFVLGVLLDQLIALALSQILALASVTVTLALEGGATHTRTVRPALPTCDRRLWLRLLHLDLQAHPPSAPILAVILSAEPGATSKVQQGLFTPQLPEPSRLDVTLARIRSIVGDNCVGSPVLEDSHRPDAFRMAPFTLPATPSPVPGPTPQPRTHPGSARRRLRPPEPVTVTLRERRPASFVFRNQRYTVERAWGPWFFSGNWWGIQCWSIEKWDVLARAEGSARSDRDGAMISCALARNPLHPSAPQSGAQGTPTPLRPATLHEWRLEELYD